MARDIMILMRARSITRAIEVTLRILQPPSYPIPATHCLYILSFYFGKGGGGGMREKVKEAIVHKAGSNIPALLTVSPVYKLY